MCPKPNDTKTELSKTSYVEELGDGVPGLFMALTSEPDLKERWLSITYPVDHNLLTMIMNTDNQLMYHHLRKFFRNIIGDYSFCDTNLLI